MPRVGLPLSAQPLWLPTEVLAAGPWEDIASSRLSAAAASVSFQNIPAAFVMFRLYAEIIQDGTGGSFTLRFNNDSGVNYDYELLLGNDVSVTSARTTGATSLLGLAVDANAFAVLNATVAKPIAGAAGLVQADTVRTTGATLRTAHSAGIWNNTADLLNRIDLLTSAGNFAVGTLCVLQGSRF